MRALPVVLALMDQARAWKHDKDLGLTGPRRRSAGIGGARGRVMAWPAAGYGVVAAGGLRGEEDEQA